MLHSLLSCPVLSNVKLYPLLFTLHMTRHQPHPTLLMAGICSALDAVRKERRSNSLIGISINLIYREDKTINDKEVAINHFWVRDRCVCYFMDGRVTLLLSVLEQNYDMGLSYLILAWPWSNLSEGGILWWALCLIQQHDPFLSVREEDASSPNTSFLTTKQHSFLEEQLQVKKDSVTCWRQQKLSISSS